MAKVAKYMPINENNKKALLKSSAIYFKNHFMQDMVQVLP